MIEKGGIEKNSDKLKPGDSYQGSIRFKLDISQLPKPFQIAAVGSKDWNFSSEWKTWQFTLPAVGENK